MRASTMIVTMTAATLFAAGADAQQAKNTPDEIICAVTNTCDAPPPPVNGKIKVGDEKAFSLARPSGARPAAAPVAATVRADAPVRRRPDATRQPARRSGSGLDMLVTFNMGSADMTPQAKAEARAFAAAMKSPQLAPMRFAIEGHTDAVGNREFNRDLSQRRAQSVVDYLVTQGVEAQRLDARGFGFDKPKPGLTPRAAGNRRVEFVREG